MKKILSKKSKEKKAGLFFLVLCLAVLTSAGCSSPGGTAVMEGKAFQNGLFGNGGSQAETEKYNCYVGFLNFNSGWFAGVTDIYFEQFGVEEEPELAGISEFVLDEEGEMYGMYSDNTEDVRAYAEKKPDFGEADDKAIAYCDAFDAFLQLYFQEVNDYYRNQEFEKDGMDGARELHGRMLESYSKLLSAEQEFQFAFEPVILEKEGEELPVFQEAGQDIHYYALKLILDSKAIQNYFYELEYEGKDFLEADLESYGPMCDTFVSDLREFERVAGDKEQAEKEYGALGQSSLPMFLELLRRMEQPALDTRAMIEAGTTEIGGEPAGLVTTGGRREPMSDFNHYLGMAINDYNNKLH